MQSLENVSVERFQKRLGSLGLHMASVLKQQSINFWHFFLGFYYREIKTMGKKKAMSFLY